MTDERSTPGDDALDARLRAGFEALEAELGPAGPMPASTPASGRAPVRRRTRLLAAAAVVATLVVGGTLVWQLTSDDPAGQRVATSPDEQGPTADPAGEGPDLPLVGTRWWLVSAEEDGVALPLGGWAAGSRTRPSRTIGLRLEEDVPCADIGESDCETQPVLWPSDVCTSVSRSFAIEGDVIILGDPVGETTAAACDDPPWAQLVGTVFGAARPAGDEVGFEIQGDVLAIRSGDAALTYKASDGAFPPVAGVVVDDGEVGRQSYQLTWGTLGDTIGLTLRVTETDVGVDEGGTGITEVPGINAVRRNVDGRAYLFAIVPAEAESVVYEPAGGAPVEVPITDVGSDSAAVVGALVDEAPPTSDLVAYAADGRELDRVQVVVIDDDGS